MKYRYDRLHIAEVVRFYASPGLDGAMWLESDYEYARARAAFATWCLDGLPCGFTDEGRPCVVLVVRRNAGPADGPFRDEPWVVGGKWDLVTPWKEFVRTKVALELLGGSSADGLTVDGPIGNQLFATGWGRGTDGPFGMHGVTIQFCYLVSLPSHIGKHVLRHDTNHSGCLVLTRDSSLADLHPYIRDVIELSGWLRAPSAPRRAGSPK